MKVTKLFLILLVVIFSAGCTEVTVDNFYTQCDITKTWVAHYFKEEYEYGYDALRGEMCWHEEEHRWKNKISDTLEVNCINGGISYKNCKETIKMGDYIFCPPDPATYSNYQRDHLQNIDLDTDYTFNVFVFENKGGQYSKMRVNKEMYQLITKVKLTDPEARLVVKKFMGMNMSVRLKSKTNGEVGKDLKIDL